MTFPSKVDRWLLVAIVSSTVTCLAAGVAVMLAAPVGQASVIGVLLLLVSAFPLWILGSTAYTLTPSHLLVRSGPFRWLIPLDSIRSVRPTRDPLSSPALSLDRLRIEYGAARWIMISPRDPDRFMAELDARRREPGH
jgi:hypothetical protein